MHPLKNKEIVKLKTRIAAIQETCLHNWIHKRHDAGFVMQTFECDKCGAKTKQKFHPSGEFKKD